MTGRKDGKRRYPSNVETRDDDFRHIGARVFRCTGVGRGEAKPIHIRCDVQIDDRNQS